MQTNNSAQTSSLFHLYANDMNLYHSDVLISSQTTFYTKPPCDTHGQFQWLCSRADGIYSFRVVHLIINIANRGTFRGAHWTQPERYMFQCDFINDRLLYWINNIYSQLKCSLQEEQAEKNSVVSITTRRSSTSRAYKWRMSSSVSHLFIQLLACTRKPAEPSREYLNNTASIVDRGRAGDRIPWPWKSL